MIGYVTEDVLKKTKILFNIIKLNSITKWHHTRNIEFYYFPIDLYCFSSVEWFRHKHLALERAPPELYTLNRQGISWKITSYLFIRTLVLEKGTCLGSHTTWNTTNVRTIPLHFLSIGSWCDCDIGNAYPSKRVPRNSIQLSSHSHILSNYISEIYVLDQREGFRVKTIIWVGPIISCDQKHMSHGFHVHSLEENVFHVSASTLCGFDSNSRFCICGDDVLHSDILNSAGHFAAESDHGLLRRRASEASDYEVFAWHSKCEAVLVPPALYWNTIVPRDNVTILNSDVRAWVYIIYINTID